MVIYRVLLSLSCFALVSCSSFTPIALPSEEVPGVYLQPTVAAETVIYEMGGDQTIRWAALTEAERRALLNGAEASYAVEQQSRSGSFTFLPAGTARVGRGNYRLRFRYELYRQMPCDPGNHAAGSVRVGVGIEVRADIQNRNRRLDITSLLPLTAAVSDNQVSGTIRVRTIGVGATSNLLGSYLTGGTSMDLESVVKAMQATAVVQALLEDPDSQTTPSYLQLFEAHSGSCRGTANVPPNVADTQI